MRLSFHPVNDFDIRHIFKMLHVVSNYGHSFTMRMTTDNHVKLICTHSLLFKYVFNIPIMFGSITRQVNNFYLFKNLSCVAQMYDFRAAFSSSLLPTCHYHAAKPETHVATPHHSCAAWHAPILLALPDARPATDDYLGSDRLTSEEYYLMIMLYSYCFNFDFRCKFTINK